MTPQETQNNLSHDRPELPEDFTDKFLDRGWLEGRSKEDLIEYIGQLTRALQGNKTDDITRGVGYGDAINFPEIVESDVSEYLQFLPAAEGPAAEAAKASWRAILISSDPTHKPVGMQIESGVVVGRKTSLVSVDLDLTPYNAEELGVSRIHAAFQPTSEGLYLSDLGSSNGTYCNNTRIKSGSRMKLKDDDVISFGVLQFKIKIIGNR
jgi:hypothetical protein